MMGIDNISAVILAAGDSRRMGRPKLLLPWGKTTVLGQVVTTFSKAGITDIVVVTGGVRDLVEGLVTELAKEFPVRTSYNPDYEHGEMLSSIKAGLKALDSQTHAALFALGDQPQVQVETVRHICTAFLGTDATLVVPSFENQRGHPWLAVRSLWDEILTLPPSTTPRQFLNAHAKQVEYITANKSILQDLDTPEDYTRCHP
jgi:molybdenum cofactor cytidylyltransferase